MLKNRLHFFNVMLKNRLHWDQFVACEFRRQTGTYLEGGEGGAGRVVGVGGEGRHAGDADGDEALVVLPAGAGRVSKTGVFDATRKRAFSTQLVHHARRGSCRPGGGGGARRVFLRDHEK